MSDLLLDQGRSRAQLGRLLVVFTGSASDWRALETALEFARSGGATLETVLVAGEYRGYSVVPGELEQLRRKWQARLVEHAFTLCDRALTAGVELPLELVDGNGLGWLCDWISSQALALVVVADRHRTLRWFAPSPIVARIRRSAAIPIVVVR